MQARLWDEHATTGKAPRLRAAPAKPVVAPAQPVIAASLAAGRGKSARHPILRTRRRERQCSALRRRREASRTDVRETRQPFRSLQLRQVAPPDCKARLRPRRNGLRRCPPPRPISRRRCWPMPIPPRRSGDAALSALLAEPSEEDLAASQDPNLDMDDDAAALPDYEDTPSGGPLPQLRPRGDQARKPAAETSEPDVRQIDRAGDAEGWSNQRRPTNAKRQSRRSSLMRGRPIRQRRDIPAAASASRCGTCSAAEPGQEIGVAVYDISAAKGLHARRQRARGPFRHRQDGRQPALRRTSR